MLSTWSENFLLKKIAASVADDADANPNGITTLLANGLKTSSIKGKPVFIHDPKRLPKNLPECPILFNWISDNFVLADEPFAKALQSLKTCSLVTN